MGQHVAPATVAAAVVRVSRRGQHTPPHASELALRPQQPRTRSLNNGTQLRRDNNNNNSPHLSPLRGRFLKTATTTQHKLDRLITCDTLHTLHPKVTSSICNFFTLVRGAPDAHQPQAQP